jgi:hypothetical protein
MEKQMAEDIAGFVETKVAAYQAIRARLNHCLVVNGKTLAEWKRIFFSIEIADNMDPILCRQYSTKIMHLNQEASTFYTMADARHYALETSAKQLYRKQYDEIVTALQTSGAKLPAATHLETMALVALDEANSMTMIAEIEKNFWRDVINYLTRCRKQLENITMNNALMRRVDGMVETPEEPESDMPPIFEEEENEDNGI